MSDTRRTISKVLRPGRDEIIPNVRVARPSIPYSWPIPSRSRIEVIRELFKLLEEDGHPDAEITRRTGISPANVNRLRTKGNTTIGTFERIAKAFRYELKIVRR